MAVAAKRERNVHGKKAQSFMSNLCQFIIRQNALFPCTQQLLHRLTAIFSLSLSASSHSFFYKNFHCMQLDLLAAAQYNYMQFSKFTYLSDGESEKAAHKCIKLNTPVSKRKKP